MIVLWMLVIALGISNYLLWKTVKAHYEYILSANTLVDQLYKGFLQASASRGYHVPPNMNINN